MKKYLIIIITLILFLSFLALPILDFFVDQDNLTVGQGPNVIIRAIVAIVMMCIIIIPSHNRTQQTHSSITGCIVFLVIYIVFISFWFSPITTNPTYKLVQVVYSWLGFLCFYKLTKLNYIDERLLSYFYLILISIVAVTAYLNLDSRIDSDRGLEKADNTGYVLVCAYAGIMLLANKKVFSFALFFVVVGTLISGKRGAIIAMSAATLPLLAFMLTNKKVKITRRLLFIILIVVGAFVALRYFSSYFDAAIERFENLEEDEGSGRGWVYLDYWNHFLQSKPANQIFGHGLFAGARPSKSQYAFTHVYAHNDWLEILFDFGVVGTVTYAAILMLILTVIIRNIRNKNVYFYMLCMSFIIWMIKSIFSSTFMMDVDSIYLYMSTAYAVAKLEQGKNANKIISTEMQYEPQDLST